MIGQQNNGYFSLKWIVWNVLYNNPKSRDDDNELIASVIEELKIVNTQNCTAKDLLKHIKKGTFGILESIGRCRRKLQEHNPEVRGEKYESRHKKQGYAKNQLQMEFWKG